MAARFYNCKTRLEAAAGRPLSDDELQAVFERIHQSALALKSGRQGPGTAPGPMADVIREAAEEASAQLVAEAERAARNRALQVTKLSARQGDVASIKAAGFDGVEALRRVIANNADGRSGHLSIEALQRGIAADLQRRVVDAWKALGDDWAGFMQDEGRLRLLLQEMRGERTGDANAAAGARAWAEATEYARQWFNDLGGEVGKLDDWTMPQHHAQERVLAAGRDAWVARMMGLVDRGRYVDDLGNAFPDARMREFLENAWTTIATDGANKIEPGQFRGTGARANRHAEARQLHFKDADSLVAYWREFGDKTAPDIMLSHLGNMARDIAFVDRFGPNPELTYRTLRDTEFQALALADPQRARAAQNDARRLDRLWDYASGRGQTVVHTSLARGFDTVQALNTSGMLGQAFWASFFGDKVMMETVATLNDLPAMRRWMDELRLLNPANKAERDLLRRQGLMLEYMTNAMHRFGSDVGSSTWAGKFANGVLRLSGMNAINEWRRGAFGLSMMASIGEAVSRAGRFADMHAQDVRLLKTYGLGEADFRLWKLAQLDDLGHGNTRVLTPEAIARVDDAAILRAFGADADPAAIRRDGMARLLGALLSESDSAVLTPGWRDRAIMFSGLERGTWKGEITRSFWQFKSFPFAQFRRAYELMMSRESVGGRAALVSSMIVLGTVMGAMILQVQETLAGKDPRDMSDWRFWIAAMMKGGTLGIYGDFLYSLSGETRYGSGPLEIVAGPTIGRVASMAEMAAKAPGQIAEGKEAKLAARLASQAKTLIPGQNLWYTKAATDHLIFQQVQEALSPGYLDHVRARTMREFRQDWWWGPGELTPERAPDLSAAVGGGR